MKAFRDPSDKIGHQQNWPYENGSQRVNPGPAVSCYDDNGTSYQWSARWIAQLDLRYGQQNPRSFVVGAKMLALAEGFIPSRFVWAFDEYADLITNQADPNYVMKNGYDQVNRSCLVFFDGHAKYEVITPGANAAAYDNDRYSLIFPDMPLPR
jgi:hypothetical protein